MNAPQHLAQHTPMMQRSPLPTRRLKFGLVIGGYVAAFLVPLESHRKPAESARGDR
jgi:hypothetical protein